MSELPNEIYGEGVAFSEPITWKRLTDLVGNPLSGAPAEWDDSGDVDNWFSKDDE